VDAPDGVSEETSAVTPPPIRYPLPTLILLVTLFLLARWGAELSRPLRAALFTRWERARAGPPVPSSSEPQRVAGPIVRRALLLHEDTPASALPGGPPVETIRHRMIADVYDVWPLQGEPTHSRIGSRRPIGWVAAADVLPWDTRLVIRTPEGKLTLTDTPDGPAGAVVAVGEVPLPVVTWTEGAIRVAVWAPDRPWTEVARLGWVPMAEVPAEAWGVWLSRDELLALIRRTLAADSSEEAKTSRMRAILGRLADNQPIAATEIEASRAALPAVVFAVDAISPRQKGEMLARLNEQWTPDVSWSGLSFRAIPLSALP
jgi:hypothetical protein